MPPNRTTIPTFPPNLTSTRFFRRTPNHSAITRIPTFTATTSPSIPAFCHPPSLPDRPLPSEPYRRSHPRPPPSRQTRLFPGRTLPPPHASLEHLQLRPPPPPIQAPEITLPSIHDRFPVARKLPIPRGMSPQPRLGSMGQIEPRAPATQRAEASWAVTGTDRLPSVEGFLRGERPVQGGGLGGVERCMEDLPAEQGVVGVRENKDAERDRAAELEFAVEEFHDMTAVLRRRARVGREDEIDWSPARVPEDDEVDGQGNRGREEEIDRPLSGKMDVDGDFGARVNGICQEEEIERPSRGKMDIDEDSVVGEDTGWAQDGGMDTSEGYSGTGDEKGIGREEETDGNGDRMEDGDGELPATSSAGTRHAWVPAWLGPENSKSLRSSIREKKDKYYNIKY